MDELARRLARADNRGLSRSAARDRGELASAGCRRDEADHVVFGACDGGREGGHAEAARGARKCNDGCGGGGDGGVREMRELAE